MNNLSERLKEMEQIKFPAGLHRKIMTAVYWQRIKPVTWGLGSLFLINSAVFGLSLWLKLMENGFFSVLRAVLEGFELSFDFLSSFLQFLGEVFPTAHFMMFAVNLVVAGLVVYFFFEFRPKYNS